MRTIVCVLTSRNAIPYHVVVEITKFDGVLGRCGMITGGRPKIPLLVATFPKTTFSPRNTHRTLTTNTTTNYNNYH